MTGPVGNRNHQTQILRSQSLQAEASLFRYFKRRRSDKLDRVVQTIRLENQLPLDRIHEHRHRANLRSNSRTGMPRRRTDFFETTAMPLRRASHASNDSPRTGGFSRAVSSVAVGRLRAIAVCSGVTLPPGTWRSLRSGEHTSEL